MIDELLTEDERRFRSEIRRTIAERLPPDLAEKTRSSIHFSRDDMARWNAILHELGWSAHHWPVEHGGPGWTPIQRYLFEAACADVDAPPLSVFGVYLVGPTIYTFGSAEQKARYLPGILSGEEFWCQGYSEPEAGSDLANLRTTARRTETGWVLNGQKAWTTEGHFADLMICLARTDGSVKPQAGLSLFVVPMDAPGVTVDPVVTIDGAHSVNSVFLDNVEIPQDALIGEENAGWTYAKFLLTHERTNNAQVHRSRREFERLKALVADLHPCGDGAQAHALRRRVAALEVEMRALELTVFRVLADEAQGRTSGQEASILKVIGSELQQSISELAMDVLGERGAAPQSQSGNGCIAAEAQAWAERHLFRRVVTIYAGSNEIQKSIIARSALGL